MEALKVDPLDLTCNSQTINVNRNSAANSSGATSHRNRNDTEPVVLDQNDQSSSGPSITGGCNNRTVFSVDDGESTEQRATHHRLIGTNAVAAAGTVTPTQGTTSAIDVPQATPQAPIAAPTGGEEAHRCDMCGKTFAVPARLTRHYRTHTGE